MAPDVPPPLETLIQRCLRKNPDDRWQSMREVQVALSALKRDSDSGSLYTTRLGPPPVAATPAVALPGTENHAAGKGALIGVIATVVVLGAAGWFFERKPAAHPVVQSPVETPSPAPVAQTPAPEPVAPPPVVASDGSLNNDGVIEMVKENLPLQVILAQIRSSKTNFDFSTAEVIRLHKAGVSAALIEAMRNPKRAPSPSNPAQPTNAKQSAPTPAPAPP